MNGRVGFGYNWSGYGGCNITNRETNDGSGGSGHWIDLDCGSNEGNYTLGVTEAATGRSGQCTFSACPSGGCEPDEPPPPPPQAVILKAATDGQDYNGTGPIPSGDWQSPLQGFKPLYDVDLWASPGNQQVNNEIVKYQFDCTSDGIIEAERFPRRWWEGGNGQSAVADLCSYRSSGNYTATDIALGNIMGFNGDWCKSRSMWCTEIGRGTVAIQVNNPPENFTITDVLWNIQSGTSQYRADYDYDNNSVLNRVDRDVLSQVAAKTKQCPQNKNCDLNNSGSVTIQDVLAYTDYLKIYEVQIGTISANNAKAGIYLSSSGGATVALTSNAPSGHSIVPSSIVVGGGGTGSSELRLPTLNSAQNYSITVTGVAGGGTTFTSSPLTLRVVDSSSSMSSQPDFVLNKNRDIFVNIVGTQAVTSNVAKITVGTFDGFSSNINLSVQSVSPVLSGATFSFSDSSLTPSEFSTGSDFSVTVPASTAPGVYTIKIRGADGGLVRPTRDCTSGSDCDIRLNVTIKDPSFREI